MPEVSVVIPTHDRSAFVTDAVDSALRQTWRDREVIVVDDGSTDDTAEKLRRYGTRIRVVRKDQGGAASARNRGVAEARGRWIAFLDSDDLWIDMKLEHQMALAQKGPEYGWLASSYWKLEGGREFRRNREGASGEVFRRVWEENFVRTSTVVVRRDAWDEVGPIREDLAINEELDWYLRMARRFPLGYIEDPLAIYRHHPGGVSRDTLKSREIYLDLIREHDDPERIPRPAARRRVAYLKASIGKHRLATGDVEGGRAIIAEAVKEWPLGAKGWRLLLRGRASETGDSGTPGEREEAPDGRPMAARATRPSPLRLKIRQGDPVRVQEVVERYQRRLEGGGMRILREGHRGRVAQLEGDGEKEAGVIVKHYRHEGPRDALRRLLGGSRASGAAGAAKLLREAGLGAPPVLGVADRLYRGLPFDSLLIMEPVTGALELDRVVSRMAPGTPEHEGVRPLLRAFAASLLEMHASGVFHADLKSCNVLAQKEESAWTFVYLDLEDVVDRGGVKMKMRIENLAQINATVPAWISVTDRLRFLLRALGKTGLDEEGKAAFRKVWARSREKDRVHYDDEGVVRESWSTDGAPSRPGAADVTPGSPSPGSSGRP